MSEHEAAANSVRQAGMSYTQFFKYAARLTSHPDNVAKLACGTCHACCYHKRIEVNPSHEPASRLENLDIVPDTVNGGFKLNKRADGGCVHLTEDGKCGVYEYRPIACRQYDCRMYGFVGIAFEHIQGQREPMWTFTAPTKADKILKGALMMLSEAYHNQLPEGQPINAADLIQFVAANIEPAKALMRMGWEAEDQVIQRMSRNERKAYFRQINAMEGPDPRQA